MGKYNKVYVITPYAFATGGVELAHQLVDYLRNHNQEAYIVYVKDDEIVDTNTVTENYKKYNIALSNSIEDDKKNMLVLPEIFFDYVLRYRKINIGCWWMSVDGRYKYTSTSFGESLRFNNTFIEVLKLIKRIICYPSLFKKNNNKMLLKEGYRITHFYQSAYAQHHLYNKGFSKVLPLSDYINTEFFTLHTSDREDIVLYNPSKGKEFTKKLIKYCKGVNFIPLKGLSRDELVSLMNKAKLYIDFGEFPGKDRLPREAIVNGCVIITGKLGASYFYEDVAIPQDYKIETRKSNIPLIKKRIDYIFGHYEDCFKDMELYKSRILEEKKVFYNEIEKAFI